MMRYSLFEILLAQVVVWLGLWLYDDYLALLLTLILTSIVLAVLIIALIAEWIEPTRVPRRYFWVMAVSVVAPVVVAVGYKLIVSF